MKKYISMFLLFYGLFSIAQHKTLKGRILTTLENGKNIPIRGANVNWKEHPIMKTVTDSLGNFELMYHEGLFTIETVKEGFIPQEIKIESVDHPVDVFLDAEPSRSDKVLDEVVIRQRANAVSIKANSASLTYTINKTELLKAACCNLAESFETNPTVDISTTNAVTGSKQIKMLGLDQKYTSITVDNMPEVRGLSSASGINFIPGTWISSIQLTKGGSTVTNGYEAITGQINTELMKYKDKNFTTINFFGNHNARLELNVINASSISNNWSNTILTHLSGRLAKEDMNHDGFLDSPISKQINIMDIIHYDGIKNNGWGSQIGIQALYDKQTGGEKKFRESTDRLTQNHYGLGIENTHFEIWNKTGFVFLDKPYQSIGLQTKFIHHNIDSYFGQRIYTGNENSFFTNLLFESIIGNTNHKYMLGASYLHDAFNEDFENTNYKRTENVPGIFAEYTNTAIKNLTLVTGVRTDFHNLAGNQVLPRINIKYSFLPKTTLRLAAGKGMRTANIFSENMQYFASSRKVYIQSNHGDIYGLKPEIAWNYGGSLIQNFKMGTVKNTFTIDYYRTDFKKQILIDLDRSSQALWFYNLDGKSFSNTFQAVWDIIPITNLELHFAYKWYDIKADYAEGRRQVPFTSKNRGLFSISYTTQETENKSKWALDFTWQYIGKQRLPNTSQNPIEYQRKSFSPNYTLMNAQLSRYFTDKFRTYLGVENLSNYKQKNPIINSENPFNSYFDTSIIYAPIVSSMFYLGFDFKL